MNDTTAPIIPTGTYYHASTSACPHLVAMADGTGRYVVVYDDGSQAVVDDVTLGGDIALCESLGAQAMYAGQLQRAWAALTAPAREPVSPELAATARRCTPDWCNAHWLVCEPVSPELAATLTTVYEAVVAAGHIGVYPQRLARAYQLALDGAVVLSASPSWPALVHGRTGSYLVAARACQCEDYAHGHEDYAREHSVCKHRLAVQLVQRAMERLATPAPVVPEAPVAHTVGQQLPEAPVAHTVGQQLPEAPASANVRLDIAGGRVKVTLRDTDEGRLVARLHALLEQYPAEG
jgi:hypothetical protein